MSALLIGVGAGFLVAAQPGPMALLLVRSTLRAGLRVGLAIGTGIACVDALYAACGAAGAAPLLAIRPIHLALGLAGAALIAWLGLRTLRSALRVRIGGELPVEVATPGRAFRTALAGTASNPATIISWGAAFAAATTAGAADRAAGAVLLVAGAGLGSLAAVSLLATLVSLGRRRAGERILRTADVLAGVGLVGFGGVLAWSALRES